jgi:hypothetical protein
MISSRKSRVKSDSGEREKNKQKEQIGTSRTNKNQEEKFEEMSMIIKDFSNKLARMENERRRLDNRNQN